MANLSSYANEDVFRELNLINFTLPTSPYFTPYVDISKYKYFNAVASTDTTTLAITAHHSVNGSGDITKEIDQVLPSITGVTNTLVDLGVVAVKTRFVRFRLTQAIGSVITFQVVFRKAPLGLSNLTNVGAGVTLYTAPNSIKTLTSNDATVVITDNGTEVDLSVSVNINRGLVTVGSVNADYPTINDAVVASNCNIRVITDIVEVFQTSLTACPHLRIELVPDITISNTITGAGDWFIGDNNLLKIEGAGAHMDLTTSGLSSQIVLQAGQTFHWGIDAELDVSGVRFTGDGSNVLLSGSARVTNCRFDGATRFAMDLFERYLFIEGCLFTVPVTLDSLVGAEPKTAIISNNIFTSVGNIVIAGATDLIFNHNIVSNNIQVTGTLTNTKITDNCIGGDLSLVSIINSTVSDNVIIGDISISGSVEFTIISSNVIDRIILSSTAMDTQVTLNNMNSQVLTNLTITGASDRVVISSNITYFNWVITGDFNDGTISDNRLSLGTGSGNVTFGGSFIDSTMTGNNFEGLVTITGAVSVSAINSNTVDRFSFGSTLANMQIVGNTMIRTGLTTLSVSGACNRVVISSNIGYNSWIFTGNFDNGNINDNRVSTGTGTGNVTFSGSFVDSNMTGNNFEGLVTITGAVNVSAINSNTVDRFSFGSTLTNMQIVGNTMIRTNLTTLSVTGVCDRVVISSNTGYNSWIFTGNFDNGNINNNRVSTGTGTGNVTFSGSFVDSNMTGNNFEGLVTITGAVNVSAINSNTVDRFSFGSTLTNMQIVGNTMIRTNLTTLSVTGVCDRVIVSSNVGYFSWIFTGNFINGTVNDNRITGGSGLGNITFSGAVSDSTISGNTIDDSINIIGVATRASIKGNVLGVSILINISNTGISTNNSITSNICPTQIRIGALPAGCIGNIISGNVALFSISANSNFIDNIVTSNRTPVGSISGFGVSDVIANNV